MLDPYPFLACMISWQCPNYAGQFGSGPACGSLGTAGAIGIGLSENGIVVGEIGACNGDSLPALWTPPGAPLAIPSTGVNHFGRAVVVNQAGVVGGSVDTNANAFRFASGSVTWLASLALDTWTSVEGINASGVLAGSSNGDNLHAAFWVATTPTAVVLPLGPNSVALDINDNNQICGWMGQSPLPGLGASPFVWHNGVTTTLPLPPNAVNNSGAATAINNLGDACGYYFTYDKSLKIHIRRGCAWIDGELIELDSLPGLPATFPLDINDAREIVGSCLGDDMRPFIWRKGEMRDLNDLVPPGSPPLEIARAINNRGQIAGEGVGPDDSIAFLLTPALPEHAGDTDCDSQVNINDLLNVINRWNPPGPVGGEPADLNRDNKIDHADLLEVIFHWGQ